MAPHIALLGDSIFDNVAYTEGEPDVVTHLRYVLPEGWRATVLAVDGTSTLTFADQLAEVPSDATHLVISLGGNDALLSADLPTISASTGVEALVALGERASEFQAAYCSAIDAVLPLSRETLVCTVYDGNLEPPLASLAAVVLPLFNDVILRVAFERRLPVIDLRPICSEPADYANWIEPSGRGGRKIAEAIARSVGAVPGHGHSRVFAR